MQTLNDDTTLKLTAHKEPSRIGRLAELVAMIVNYDSDLIERVLEIKDHKGLFTFLLRQPLHEDDRRFIKLLIVNIFHENVQFYEVGGPPGPPLSF